MADSTHASRAVSVTVQPTGPIVGSIRPPGSKSLSNRALLCAALATQPSHLTGVLRSEDTRVMIDALRILGGILQESDDGTEIIIERGIQAVHSDQPTDLFVANSGTTIRFLAAALSAMGGHYRLDGVARMRERPLGDLLDAIERLGVACYSEQKAGCPPVVLKGNGWSGGSVQVAGSVSSQFLSGLLMAAPYAQSPMEIEVTGELVSRPYVDMTCAVMRQFGAAVEEVAANRFRIEAPCPYRGIVYDIEPDASAASYHWAAAALTGGRVTVERLSRNSLQGDVGFCDVLEQMGCEVIWQDDSVTVEGKPLTGVDVDMSNISDTVQTLAIVALRAKGPTRIHGVAHNRFKETDRISDLVRELRKLGAVVEEFPDGLTITPPASIQPATIETYHDHRMAMSFALAGLIAPGIEILNPSCTAKTYPEFFADLEALTGQAHHWRS